MDKFDKFILGIFIVAAIVATMSLSSCNPYKGIGKKEPHSLKDTVRLVDRYVKTIKPKPPIVKQGKTIVIQSKDSLNFYKKLSDSLRKAPPKILTLQDSCGKEAIESYDEGYHFGYKLGLYDAKQNIPPSTHQTDTLYQDTPETLLLLYNQKLKAESDIKTVIALTKENITLQAQKAAKSNENWFWRAVALLTILYLLFKPKINTFFKSIISKFKKK